MKKISIFIISLFMASSYVFSEDTQNIQEKKAEPAVKIEKLAVGTNVDKRELVGESTTFSSDTSRVYVWTRVVEVSTTPTTVDFVFYFNDKKVDDVKLDIKGTPFRTWAIKTVMPGNWKVELRDAEGNVVSTSEFKVESSSISGEASASATLDQDSKTTSTK